MDHDLERFKSRKLNIGCGFDLRPGYINIDLQSFHRPDIVAGVLDLSVVPSNWAEEIIASDLLEHIGRRQTCHALLEWNRVLSPGGRLYVRTTYLPGLLKRITYDWFGSIETHKQLINDLFSTQAYEGDYHFTAFTEKLMRFYMWACGFEIGALDIQDNWLFVVHATKAVDYSYADLVATTASDRDFVLGLYREVLRREPDDEGLAGKLALLEAGESRLGILRGIVGSVEREDMMVASAPEFELTFDPA